MTLLNFPNTKEKEMITENADGSYTIFINAKFSYATQLAAYEHALKHINNHDFEKSDVQAIEAITHQATIADETEHIPADKFKDRIKQLQKERRKIQRQLKKKEKEIAFIQKHAADPDDYFMRAAENYWLYGDKL